MTKQTYGEWRTAHPYAAEFVNMCCVLAAIGAVALLCWGFWRNDSQAAPKLPPHTDLPALADGITLVTITVKGTKVPCLVIQTEGMAGPQQALSCDWRKP